MDYSFFQGLKVSFRDLHLINVYRLPKSHRRSRCISTAPERFLKVLMKNLDDEMDTIICGDFNFKFLTERGDSPLWKDLRRKGFQRIIKEPITINRTCIDHVYIRLKNLCTRHELYSPHYADDDGLLIMLKKKITM